MCGKLPRSFNIIITCSKKFNVKIIQKRLKIIACPKFLSIRPYDANNSFEEPGLGNLGEILWLEMGGPFGIHKLG